MTLAIDIGNTNIKIGAFRDGKLTCTLRIASVANKTGDEYGTAIMDLLSRKGISPSDIRKIIIGSVNPGLNYTFEHLCRYYFGITPLVVGRDIVSPLALHYDSPSDLGADRLADCVAAVSEYGSPLIVIDFGTATTFNVIGPGGAFLGGAISFGLKTSADAMIQHAAKLPKIELAAPDRALATSTISGMQSGIVLGFVGLVEHMIARLRRESALPTARVIATGGLSEIVRTSSDCIDVVDRELTLKGLLLLSDCVECAKNNTKPL